jgi:organic hydroperoxide reductase OsmC/OhrA
MKVPIHRAHARVRGEFYEEGSVLRGTVTSGCTNVTLEVDLDSPGDPERIGQLMRAAEQNCFVSQAVVNPVTVELEINLNGSPLGAAGSSDRGSGDV